MLATARALVTEDRQCDNKLPYEVSMQLIRKDGIALAYEDSNSDLPPMLLLHGLGCDHTFLAAQAMFFSKSHRVVSVDLRGHGKSDAPDQDYTMAMFAGDLAWLCEKLRLIKPVVIGHSMGGSIALELAARYPDVPASIVLLNSFVFMPPAILDMEKMVLDRIKGSEYVAAYRESTARLFIPTDENQVKERFLASHPRAPQHVLTSAFANHITQYDGTSAATGCHVPVAHIGDITTAISHSDLAHFQDLTPQLTLAVTLGSGHFAPLIVPDQMNAMLARFITLHAAEEAPIVRDHDCVTSPLE
jgi:pimeloyl-ACP methyl ester carboxylesterase